jgi:selenocysteine lyase/cysteine desulfurase
MSVNRRNLLRGLGALSVASTLASQLTTSAIAAEAAPTLPDRKNFSFAGIHLNAAYTHPIGRFASAAADAYMAERSNDPERNWPAVNARDEAVALYAELIGASPAEIAVVPSTLEGENLIAAALDLGPGAGVITDAFHYDASLVMYGEKQKLGMPLVVLAPRDNRIDYDALERAITPETRLIAVSLVSSISGYMHDLKRICELAHARNVLVYADLIQAVGAIPFDVRDSGVDFCCAGAYKWLMGEFGCAFLYVKAGVLSRLRRVQLGWRGVERYQSHALPADPPGPPVGEWQLGTSTASIFEVSTPSWGALATTVGGLKYIKSIGVAALARHRTPMLERLRQVLVPAGYSLLTPPGFQGPSLVFARSGVGSRYRSALKSAHIYTTLYQDRIRIAPSVHNSMSDIDRLTAILTGANA